MANRFELIRQAVLEELELRRGEIDQEDTNWFSIKIVLMKDHSGPAYTMFQSERKKELFRPQQAR